MTCGSPGSSARHMLAPPKRRCDQKRRRAWLRVVWLLQCRPGRGDLSGALGETPGGLSPQAARYLTKGPAGSLLEELTMTVLRSYVTGTWVEPADEGRPVLDAVTGEVV